MAYLANRKSNHKRKVRTRNLFTLEKLHKIVAAGVEACGKWEIKIIATLTESRVNFKRKQINVFRADEGFSRKRDEEEFSQKRREGGFSP